jgi:hypothetical protein
VIAAPAPVVIGVIVVTAPAVDIAAVAVIAPTVTMP